MKGPMPLDQQNKRLIDILQRGENNFDLIRLVAALAVIFGHSFYIFPTGGHTEPVALLIKNNFSGGLAVAAFFFISGILITQSFVSSRSPLRFSIMRIARIYPGAIVCLLFTVFFLGPISSSLGFAGYFRSPQTYRYLWHNWSFVRLWPPVAGWVDTLPGVFEKNVIPRAVNGSLWTLTPELVCYTYILGLGLAGCLRSRLRILATIGVLLAVHYFDPHFIPYFTDDHYSNFLRVALFFLAGVAAFAARELLVIRGRYCVILAALAAALQWTPINEYALHAALFYLVLIVAASPRLRRVRLGGDYSYGIYIYGFPVQQTVGHFFPLLTSYPSNLICLPISAFLGCLSWRCIESPCLKFARRLKAERREKIEPGEIDAVTRTYGAKP